MRQRRILLVANGSVGSAMAGPGIRYQAFARELSKTFEVVLVVPFSTDAVIERVEVVHIPLGEHAALTRLARSCDTVVAQRLPLSTLMQLARSPVRVIHDLYAPTVVENLAVVTRGANMDQFELKRRANHAALKVALATGDAFICASERQRDLWLGALMTAGRIEPELYGADPTLRSLIDTVPFGIDQDPPRAAGPVVKGVVPGIGREDTLLLWPGGVWDWVDPLTVIRAVHELAGRRPDLRLFFLGLTSPNQGRQPPAMALRSRELARTLGVEGRFVFFNDGWVPYDQRGAYLAEADLGVSAHFDDIETRFAYRSRLLDCIWARLPVVTTSGDVLGDLVAERALGRVVPPADVAAWVGAIDELLRADQATGNIRQRIDGVARELTWERAVEPLTRLAESPVRSHRKPARALLEAAGYLWFRGRIRSTS
jgi:glycosyltransferase involved in cell wall biosynthesis